MMNETIYYADPDSVQVLQRIRERVHQCCGGCVNRTVRVQMMDGSVYEGTVMQLDDRHLYLSVPQIQTRAFLPGFGFNPAANVILPLVLYELLVISLLS